MSNLLVIKINVVMSDAKDVAEYFVTAVGASTNFFYSCKWVTVQTFMFVLSIGLAAFDTFSDWKVVFDFKDKGFENPLLPLNIHWLQALFVFATIGSVLSLLSFLNEGIELLCSMHKSCQKNSQSSTDQLSF